jgi:hypothetical protein
MKEIIFILIATFLLQPAIAQLKNTRWEGSIKGDNPRNTMLDFKKDTLILYSASGNEVVERMTYTATGNTFTIKKIEGQSDCDSTTPGKYGFQIKGDKMQIKLISDVCYDRSSALDITNWTKQEHHRK